MDICQSVLASFFLRAASGQYEIETPGQLLKLLAAMARNKLAFQARKHRAQCRDHRRLSTGDDAEVLAGTEASPERQVAAHELLAEVQRRLSAEERQLVELRQQGLGWAEIAERVQGSAEALRKQMTRALDRVASELGLDEDESA
jgi:RNA polymerase sigma-70 factor (ECF subfamily)